jgi:hypothetical protein
MSDLRKAAHQALEAYNQHDPLGVVMAELHAALAQPDPVEVREGWEYMREKGLLRQPLTVDQIYEVLGYGARAQYSSLPQYAIECVRAVEKAHGIGG